ncbi:unnamed protein product [Schistocephalus solidus]|uniref:Class II aldolase/adducin N-terminal domain-containing protein n=1 Tax=Schistocephalus solidus TaxID=70667 RepID=A0A3P7CI93_SCHSO|nr:unnamed protein product [Schistocephalus solidus]
MRPAVIKEDVKLMQQRRRVSLILRSQAFRQELEKIVASQMRNGELSSNVLALKQLLDIFTPHTKFGSSAFSKDATLPVIPINDLISGHSPYSKPEKLWRCKLAATYRLIDIFGWSSGVTSHISARIFKDSDAYLFNPRGLLFNEMAASSLVKVDLTGTVIDEGCSGLGIDKQGWMLHATIYEALPNVRCIIQLSTPATIAASSPFYCFSASALCLTTLLTVCCCNSIQLMSLSFFILQVSCMNSGLLPISQEAMMLGKVATYDPSSAARSGENDKSPSSAAERRKIRAAEESDAIKACLTEVGTEPRLMLIKKYGILTLGRSVEEAWMIAYLTTTACESQLRLASLSPEELVLPSSEATNQAFECAGAQTHSQLLSAFGTSENWRPGELEFEAMMRRLDGAGYRTGHLYRIGQVRGGASCSRDATDGLRADHSRRSASLGRRPHQDIEVPPTATSFAANYYTDGATRYVFFIIGSSDRNGDRARLSTIQHSFYFRLCHFLQTEDFGRLLKMAAEHRRKTLSLQRMHWKTTPNAYQREEIEEIGTANPKKIMHWTEGGKKTTGGTVLASEDPNQFAPQGSDPRELQANLKKVRDNYYKDVRTAGPQSKILDGLDFDDVDTCPASPKVVSPRGTLLRLDPANPPQLEPGHVVVVGAVSKGIISRDQRHNVGLFQSVFSPNPFDQVTDDDLARYKRNVERKAKGLPTEEEEEAMERQRRAATLQPDSTARVAPEPQRSRKPSLHHSNLFCKIKIFFAFLRSLHFFSELQLLDSSFRFSFPDLANPTALYRPRRQLTREPSTLADFPSSLLASAAAPCCPLSSVDSNSTDASVGVGGARAEETSSVVLFTPPLVSDITEDSLTRPSVPIPWQCRQCSPFQAGDAVSQTSALEGTQFYGVPICLIEHILFLKFSIYHFAVPRQAPEFEAEGIRSDTSVGEFSGGEVEKPEETTETKVHHKKRRFKMPLFARKSRDKKKQEASKS